MAVVAKSYLLEAGVHFGHQTKRWNPKMKEYIFTARDDIHIIDLQKTVEKIEEAYAELLKACENGGKVLFVGTKKQAKEACQEEAVRCKSHYVTERWLGGLLTNFRTVKERIKRMAEIEAMKESGKFELLPKKEVAKIEKEYAKLQKLLGGVREMDKLPKAVIVVDPRAEINAIREALPHRYPMLLVDRVLEVSEDEITAIKNVTINEPFFNGHFPQYPVMPGVLIMEALAQTAGVLELSKPENKGKLVFYAGMDKVKFKKQVVPGDQLVMTAKFVKRRGTIAVVEAKAEVDGKRAASGTLTFAIGS